MLTGINPLLTGELLRHLDAMGHSDTILVADAHFPASRISKRFVDFPGVAATDVLAAIRSVVPADDAPALELMSAADGTHLAIYDDLTLAAGVRADEVRYLDRHAFYAIAAEAYVIVRTGEQRTYGNALFHKGIVTSNNVMGAVGGRLCDCATRPRPAVLSLDEQHLRHPRRDDGD